MYTDKEDTKINEISEMVILKRTEKIRESEKRNFSMKRKQYSKEVELQDDSLILTRKHPVRFILNQLDVHGHTLYRWISEYEKYGERTFPGNGNREFASQREVIRLEKNEKLKEGLEILKKFQFFSNKTRSNLLLYQESFTKYFCKKSMCLFGWLSFRLLQIFTTRTFQIRTRK